MANALIDRKIITTPDAPYGKPPKVPLSQAVQMNNIIHVSGQLGMTPEGKMVEGFEAQTRLALENVKTILAAAGATLNNVQKVQVFLADMKNFPVMNQIYREYFTDPYPARTAFAVKELPIAGGLIEIDAVAMLGQITDI